MADVYGGPFGTYVDVAGIIVAASQTDVGEILVPFAALFGITLVATQGVAGSYTITEGESHPHPDFDKITIEMQNKIGVELSAVWDAIDAAPVV